MRYMGPAEYIKPACPIQPVKLPDNGASGLTVRNNTPITHTTTDTIGQIMKKRDATNSRNNVSQHAVPHSKQRVMVASPMMNDGHANAAELHL